MEKAFVYGMSVEGENFTDRVKETKRLKLDLENGINVILVSPRRIGKSSIVRKVMKEMADMKIKMVFMDIYDCRSEYDFYNRFASELLKQTATKTEQVIGNIKKFLVRLTPKIAFSPEPMSDFSLSLGITPQNYEPEEILQLPEMIGQAQGIHIVVCIDEFQQIGELGDSVAFQKKLRSVWQHQHLVSYCLYGSKRHLLINMFGKRSYPFYKFGDVLFLERIPLDCWQEYVQERFVQTGKRIDARLVEEIYNYVDGNSSYVQQLCWLVWTRTSDEASDEVLDAAKQDLLKQNHALFMEQTNSLTSYQIRFVKAILAGKALEINHKSTIEDFGLGSSSNISTIKKALQKKELVDIEGKEIRFSDPIFEHWLRQNYHLFV